MYLLHVAKICHLHMSVLHNYYPYINNHSQLDFLTKHFTSSDFALRVLITLLLVFYHSIWIYNLVISYIQANKEKRNNSVKIMLNYNKYSLKGGK